MGVDPLRSSDALPFAQEEIDGSVPARFARVVSAFPDAIAVRSSAGSLTYRELGQSAASLGQALRACLGDDPEIVALLLSSGISTTIALMGVITAGKSYCALNPDDPVNRIKAILADLGARLLITDESLHPLASEVVGERCEVMKLDALAVITPGSELTELNLSGKSQAGVYYTSGSTGEPKGVPRDHSAMLYRAWLDSSFFGIRPGDRLIMLRPFMFSGSSGDISSTLLTGASLCLYDVKRLGISSLSEYVKRHEITIFRPPIELLRYFVDSLEKDDFFPSIRCLVLSGDVLYRKDINQIRQHFPKEATIVHHLAASETGVLARLVIGPDTVIDGDIVPVGYPVQDKEILILDENGRKIDPGAVGEIAVRSRLIIPSVDHPPDWGEDHFITDPDNPSQSVYLTGDLGRVRPDGMLEFVGRRDLQFKIRGFRVNAPAIVSRLLEVDGIKRAAVTARADPSGEKRLVAYVTVNPQVDVSTETIRAELAKNLPDYMLPSAVLILDEMPVSPNGKLDYRRLPAPDWSHPRTGALAVPPRDELESQIVGIWREVLRVETIGIRDDFFALGGHSLMAVVLVARIERELGKKLYPAVLFENNTVETLARFLRQQTHWYRAIVPIQAGGSRPPLFLAPGNQGDTLYLRNLAAHLGPDQPLFGLQATDFGDALPTLTDLPSMAAYFVNLIREIQPAGPYYLGGHSFGGRLAWAIARLMLDAGDAVALLALIDTFAPGQRAHATLRERIHLHAANLRGMAPREWPRYFHGRLDTIIIRLSHNPSARSFIARFGLIPADVSVRNRMASAVYKYPFYPGKLTFFRVGERPYYVRADLTAGWKDYAAELEVHDVAGEHGSLLNEPYVATLAQALEKALEDGRRSCSA